MPKFPDINPEITYDCALNMILASIAMEEVALSNIVNAEGERIQYVLGTLETSSGKKPSVDEILKVNQSVTYLMDSISQYQIILKNKMDKALYAISEIDPNPPKSVCPPDSPYPAGPQGPTGSSCKCSAAFKAAEKCKLWCSDSLMHWNIDDMHGKCVCYNPCDKAKIELRTKGRFVVNFSANVRAKDYKCNAAISLQMIKNHQLTNIYTIHSHVPHDDTTVTLSMNGIIIKSVDYSSSLFFKLKSPDSLIVEDSILSIIEI